MSLINITFLEGPDCSGKTTEFTKLLTNREYAQKVWPNDLLHTTYIGHKFGSECNSGMMWARHDCFLKIIHSLDTCEKVGDDIPIHIICDRSYLSELIYSPILKPQSHNDSRVREVVCDLHARYCEAASVVEIIYFDTHWEVIKNRLQSRGDELLDQKTLHEAYLSYTDLNAKVFSLNVAIANKVRANGLPTFRKFSTI